MPSMPDITKAQMTAFVSALAVVANLLFKLDISDKLQAELVTGIGAAYVIGHMVSDAIIRKGRSQAVAAVAIENAAVAGATGVVLPTVTLQSPDDFQPTVSTEPDVGDAASEPAS